MDSASSSDSDSSSSDSESEAEVPVKPATKKAESKGSSRPTTH